MYFGKGTAVAEGQELTWDVPAVFWLTPIVWCFLSGCTFVHTFPVSLTDPLKGGSCYSSSKVQSPCLVIWREGPDPEAQPSLAWFELPLIGRSRCCPQAFLRAWAAFCSWGLYGSLSRRMSLSVDLTPFAPLGISWKHRFPGPSPTPASEVRSCISALTCLPCVSMLSTVWEPLL